MATVGSAGSARTTRRVAPPLEHRILMTATLCLLAFGAVMVYSASSSVQVINGSGYGTSQFVTYLVAAGIGLFVMRVGEFYGMRLMTEPILRWVLYGAFFLLVVVLIPGLGRQVLGARRWFAFGPLQFQPSELMKLAIVMYLARYLADHPKRMDRPFKQAVGPVAVVLAPAALLIAIEPDLGTTLVVFFTVMALLVVAGMPMRYLGRIAAIAVALGLILVIARPYELARLTAFLHPWSAGCQAGNCYQTVQGQIAVGSGGIFGVGLGNSVQKLFWLPEAQTDFILAVIGEELGMLGIFAVLVLYGMIAYAGMRTARRAASRHAKLLASGLTSLILCQGILNIFVVLGIAPLTGVPLPFISYAPTNLIVMMGSVGLLMGITRPAARELRLVDQRGQRTAADARDRASDPDRGGRDGRARRTGARGRGRAAG